MSETTRSEGKYDDTFITESAVRTRCSNCFCSSWTSDASYTSFNPERRKRESARCYDQTICVELARAEGVCFSRHDDDFDDETTKTLYVLHQAISIYSLGPNKLF